MDKALWKNCIILLVSIILVIGFMYGFSLVYDKVRIKPPYEVCDYRVEVQIQRKDSSYAKIDSCQYKIIPAPKVYEYPIEANDYSSFLVSFISVLATFVVIANFANAKDLVSAAENAENAEKAANLAKSKAEAVLTTVSQKIEEVNNTLNEVRLLKDEVLRVKGQADETLKNSTQQIEKLNVQIESQFIQLTSQIEKANESISNAKADLEQKYKDLYKMYDDVNQLTKISEENLSKQKAELNAASSRIAEVENRLENLDTANQVDNQVTSQVQHDTEQINQEPPKDIDITNNNA